MLNINDLKEYELFFETLLNSMVSAVLLVDKDQKILGYNDSFKTLCHQVHADSPAPDCPGGAHCSACKLRDSLVPHLVYKVPVHQERMTRKFLIDSQEVIRYFLYSTRYVQINGQEQILVIVDDITETMEAQLKVKRMEFLDPLTQMYNHKRVQLKLEEEMIRAFRYGNNLSVIMLDIDNFKEINRTYGHQVGDNTLITISRLIKKNLRDIDVAGRYDGVEFLVILPQTLQEHAYRTAERIRQAVADHIFDEQGLKVTISGSVTEFQQQQKSALHLTDKAELLLHAAKEKGRNRIEV